MKDEYLDMIRLAGFEEVSVREETLFPIESLVCEAAGPAGAEMPKISPNQLRELSFSVLSIKIAAVKPEG
jgi:hypothetical protein